MSPLTFAVGAVALKAKALLAGWTDSATMSESYAFDDGPPTVLVDTVPYAVNG